MSDVFIITQSGKRFDFLEPTVDMIDINDIAVGLSNAARFAGQTDVPYTVAQHSILVAKSLPLSYRLSGLMHDASEAYIGDITGPLKRWLGPEIKRIETNIERVIFESFGIDYPPPKIVKTIDLCALGAERRDLIPPSCDWPVLDGVEPLAQPIGHVWDHYEAREQFLTWFNILMCWKENSL